ncbi:MAG TPA: DUF3618 domain-containing protein [Burkholderiales bacterium]|nr:DUF3618 domain-containing protein [Burkholderiales bacterium]
MKDNGGRRPEQILTEIYRTRDELEKTLVAIEHRLTPGQLVDQGLDYLRHSGANDFVQNLGGAAKQNPLPVALVGIGLAWLMALGRQPAQNYGSSISSSGLQESMASMRNKASEAAHSAAESMHSMRERARGSMDYLVHEQPLALGAIGLAIGAVLGAAAPRTRQEERLMGEASRGLAEKAKDLAAQQLDKAQQAVKQVAEEPAAQPRAQPQPQTQIQSQHPGPTAAGPDKKGAW